MRPNRFTPVAWIALFAILLAAACQEPPRPGAAAPPSDPAMDEDGRLLPKGLGPFADQIIEAMGTRAERAARAPYSPPDWPYERGELVKSEQHTGVWLHETFGMWTRSAEAPFWVGKRVFGARWAGASKPGDTWLYQEYVGHFPVRTVDPHWFRRLPDHLADVNPVDLQAVLFDSVHVTNGRVPEVPDHVRGSLQRTADRGRPGAGGCQVQFSEVFAHRVVRDEIPVRRIPPTPSALRRTTTRALNSGSMAYSSQSP